MFKKEYRSSCFYDFQEQIPVIEGQLKEKKGGKWKIFKKWKSRYFTLSGAKLSYKDSVSYIIFENVNLVILLNNIIIRRMLISQHLNLLIA